MRVSHHAKLQAELAAMRALRAEAIAAGDYCDFVNADSAVRRLTALMRGGRARREELRFERVVRRTARDAYRDMVVGGDDLPF